MLTSGLDFQPAWNSQKIRCTKEPVLFWVMCKLSVHKNDLLLPSPEFGNHWLKTVSNTRG